MTLLAIVVGIYLISYIGFFKITIRSIASDESSSVLLEAYPKTVLLAVAVMSLLWPVSTLWTFAREASR